MPRLRKEVPGIRSGKQKRTALEGTRYGRSPAQKRIFCTDHGVRYPAVPWTYEGSRFTKDFDRTAAWLACQLSRKAVAEYMRIDWKTEEHKYLTVIVDHDRNSVVWLHDGHGKSVLEKFYEELTEEQRKNIKVVTGDGAKWITECVEKYTPDCVRCMDSFHVAEWATAALDEVRIKAWRGCHCNREGSGGYSRQTRQGQACEG